MTMQDYGQRTEAASISVREADMQANGKVGRGASTPILKTQTDRMRQIEQYLNTLALQLENLGDCLFGARPESDTEARETPEPYCMLEEIDMGITRLETASVRLAIATQRLEGLV
jgi:hypothetical protein